MARLAGDLDDASSLGGQERDGEGPLNDPPHKRRVQEGRRVLAHRLRKVHAPFQAARSRTSTRMSIKRAPADPGLSRRCEESGQGDGPKLWRYHTTKKGPSRVRLGSRPMSVHSIHSSSAVALGTAALGPAQDRCAKTTQNRTAETVTVSPLSLSRHRTVRAAGWALPTRLAPTVERGPRRPARLSRHSRAWHPS